MRQVVGLTPILHTQNRKRPPEDFSKVYTCNWGGFDHTAIVTLWEHMSNKYDEGNSYGGRQGIRTPDLLGVSESL